MTTTIHVVGTIATDPRLIRPASGAPLCSFRLASDERRFDRSKQEWIDGDTNWFSVVAFRGLACHAHESFSKGDRIMVSGRFKLRSWEKEDRRGLTAEIEAEAIGHDVRWGVSTFEKRSGQRGDGEQAADAAAEQASAGTDTAEADSAEQGSAEQGGAELGTLEQSAAQSDSPEDIGWAAAA